MFDKPIDITKVYGSPKGERLPKGVSLKKYYRKEYNDLPLPIKVLPSQLRHMWALQKLTGEPTSWNSHMTHKEAEQEISRLTRLKRTMNKR